ncbi:MAG TPA: universal stress protein [Dongiaceae bacterium]|nr:universal stress protein [Dongiaceae bacterium]
MNASAKPQRVTFRNILFATDFSEAAERALPYAAGLARSFAANLYAIHVQEPVNYALPVETWQSVELAEEQRIQKLAEAIRKQFPELSPKLLLGEGTVRGAVEAAVQAHEVDLIVVGTRGRTGLGKALLGSQAEAIVREAKCPVLTVGPHADSELRQRGKVSSILFATNFGPGSCAAAHLAVSLAEEYQAKLTLLHVIEHKEAQSGIHEEIATLDENALRRFVPAEAKLWCQPHYIVEWGEPAERILKTAARTSADLIVLGVHAPEGVPGAATHLPNTVHRVVAQAECAVMTVKAKRECKHAKECV